MMKPAARGPRAAGANKPLFGRLTPESPNCGQAKAPPGDTGWGLPDQVLLAALPRPRPEQGVAFPTLVVEKVRVDRCIEGGIVELEGKIVAAFLGALRPCGADLGPTHIDAVARSVVVGAAGFCDDADAFGLQAE